jgi:hypothetical protein
LKNPLTLLSAFAASPLRRDAPAITRARKQKSPPLPAGWCGSKTVMTLDLHANSCRAVRGTVMVAVVDVVDQRH